MLLIQLFGHDAVVDQTPQAFGQDRSGDPQVGAQLIEPPEASQRGPYDQDRPTVTDDRQRVLDRRVGVENRL